MIEHALLTAGSSTINDLSYDTASFDHQPDTLIMAWITITASTSPAPVPTLSGHGITWELQARPTDSARSLFLFVGTAGSGDTGPLTISLGAFATSALWVITELTGVDLSGGGASSAILQTKTSTASTNNYTITLDAPITGDNQIAAAWQNAVQETAAVTSPGVLDAQQSQSAPTSTMIAAHRTDTGDSLNFTTTTSSAGRAIAVEIIASSATPQQGSATGAFTFTGSATGTNQPAVPTNLQATAISATEIDLSWDAVSGATGYDIERDGTVIVFDHPTNSYSDTGLTAATDYDYRVRAVV